MKTKWEKDNRIELILPPMIKHWDTIPYWKKHGANPMGPKSPFRQRNTEIVYMRLQGYTVTSIANKYNISRERVRQIYETSIMAFWAAMENENARFESIRLYKIGATYETRRIP